MSFLFLLRERAAFRILLVSFLNVPPSVLELEKQLSSRFDLFLLLHGLSFSIEHFSQRRIRRGSDESEVLSSVLYMMLEEKSNVLLDFTTRL